MERALSRVTTKYQATIPREVREMLGIRQGDRIVFEMVGGQVTLRRAMPGDVDFLVAVEGTLSEWLTSEDDEAFRDL